MAARKVFGATLDLAAARCDLPQDTLVPGVAVYSRRADPLAAWTNALDLAAVSADTDRAFLILETGFNQRWRWGGERHGCHKAARALLLPPISRQCRGAVAAVGVPGGAPVRPGWQARGAAAGRAGTAFG